MKRSDPAARGDRVLRGDICYARTPTELTTLRDGYVVCVDGRSEGVFRELPEKYQPLPVHDYTGMLVIPGLVDLHIHAPQYAFRGMGMDMELMEWLQKQTFPEETKYGDLDYARRAYSQFVQDMRQSATTHACIFATRHREATELLMELMEQSGLVSCVGKVNMDRDAPEGLREESAQVSERETVAWLDRVRGKFRHTKPILTPRFVPCCTEELLEKLGELQREQGLPVQSHLSENPGEVELVRRLCPESPFYGDVYDRYGLFGKDHHSRRYGDPYDRHGLFGVDHWPVPTIMAHCVYSGEEEMERIRENGVFVAHCPASNTNLASGIAPVRKYLRRGLRVGLGSDVAGGHTASILRAACDAVQVSKLYWRLVDENDPPLTFREAFYLASAGGGAFFGKVGSFAPGYEFSAVVLDDRGLRRPFELTVEQRLEQAAYSGLDLYGVRAKFVAEERLFETTA